MEIQDFITHTVPTLSDLELAVLLSLIAKQHCLVYSEDNLVDSLASELALIVSERFRLRYAIVEAEDLQSTERFGDIIIGERHNPHRYNEDEDDADNEATPTPTPTITLNSRVDKVQFSSRRRTQVETEEEDSLSSSSPPSSSLAVVNVVIAKDFNLACEEVQFQALELINRNRIFGSTAIHQAPKTFLFLPLVSSATRHVRLTYHLNDRIFMSHYHSREHGFPLLEEMTDGNFIKIGLIQKEIIDQLRYLGRSAAITPEIRRYLQDVVVFLRVERDVDGGVTPYAGVNFLDLAKYLAPLHGIDFVTPSLIGLAAKKVYIHRLIVSSSSPLVLPLLSSHSQSALSDSPKTEHDENDKVHYDNKDNNKNNKNKDTHIDQQQYRIPAVRRRGRDPEEIIESVLEKVDCPL